MHYYEGRYWGTIVKLIIQMFTSALNFILDLFGMGRVRNASSQLALVERTLGVPIRSIMDIEVRDRVTVVIVYRFGRNVGVKHIRTNPIHLVKILEYASSINPAVRIWTRPKMTPADPTINLIAS